MNEEFEKEIRKRTEKLKIPESLNEENIINKIVDDKGRRKPQMKKVVKIASTIAAGIVLMVGLSIASNIEKFHTVKSVLENVQTASSYEEIYSYFDRSIFEDFFTTKDGTDNSIYEIAEDESTYDLAGYDYSDTNIQVEGVDEGDIVKTNGRYIFIADNNINSVRIFDTEKEEVVTSVSTLQDNIYEMYLLEDKLVIISGNYMYADNAETFIYTYDISDIDDITSEGTVKQDGYYTSSRMKDDYLYLFTDYYMYQVYKDECVPTVNEEQMEATDVYLTCDIASPNFQVITSLDVNNPEEFINTKSILGYYSQFYVSRNNIYVATGNGTETQIIKLSYKDGIIKGEATGSVDGYLNNSFSLDEYEGNLRVVSTLNDGTFWIEDDVVFDGIPETVNQIEEGNSLYVLNQDLELIGSVENLAPGEVIYSARFIEDIAYFVTYERMDPLFAVDLSDPENPEVLSELKITGFSDYLHPWSEDILLGIGQETDPDTGENKGIKISMFDISNPENVFEKDKVVNVDYGYTNIGYNHKAILVNAQNNIIGFYGEGTNEYYNPVASYLVYTYSEEEGYELVIEHKYADEDNLYDYYFDYDIRGIYIDDKIYIVSPLEGIVIYSLEDYSQLKQIDWE